MDEVDDVDAGSEEDRKTDTDDDSSEEEELEPTWTSTARVSVARGSLTQLSVTGWRSVVKTCAFWTILIQFVVRGDLGFFKRVVPFVIHTVRYTNGTTHRVEAEASYRGRLLVVCFLRAVSLRCLGCGHCGEDGASACVPVSKSESQIVPESKSPSTHTYPYPLSIIHSSYSYPLSLCTRASWRYSSLGCSLAAPRLLSILILILIKSPRLQIVNIC